MYSLSTEQKQLVFDHSLGLADDALAGQAQALITNSREAASIHSKLKTVLSPLGMLRPEPCPDELAQRTVWRLVQLANAQQHVREPIAVRSGSWRNLAEIGAIAAVFFLAAGVLIPSFAFARYQYRKIVCQSQLAGIGNGISRYCSDYEGRLPAVTADLSQPWCNVGDQGPESQSNTRNLYLMLKLGYCPSPSDFLCAGREQERPHPLKASEVGGYNDFPNREHVGYSYRVLCRHPVEMSMLAGQPLIADRNPVFENIQAGRFAVRLDEKLSTAPSRNHNRQGQNVLFTDGHAGFLKTRQVGIPQDDIFTVQNVVEYRGNERPVCERDPFLAP